MLSHYLEHTLQLQVIYMKYREAMSNEEKRSNIYFANVVKFSVKEIKDEPFFACLYKYLMNELHIMLQFATYT